MNDVGMDDWGDTGQWKKFSAKPEPKRPPRRSWRDVIIRFIVRLVVR